MNNSKRQSSMLNMQRASSSSDATPLDFTDQLYPIYDKEEKGISKVNSIVFSSTQHNTDTNYNTINSNNNSNSSISNMERTSSHSTLQDHLYSSNDSGSNVVNTSNNSILDNNNSGSYIAPDSGFATQTTGNKPQLNHDGSNSNLSLMNAGYRPSLYKLNNNSSGTLLPLQTTISNVEFNNVRTSVERSREKDHFHYLHHNSEKPKSLHKASSTATLSRLGKKDNKLTRFFNKTVDKTKKKNEEMTNSILGTSLTSSSGSSAGTLTNSILHGSGNIMGSGSGSGLSAKLKKPSDLSLQTNLMTSSRLNSELKSPLIRTSKEVERIASIGLASHDRSKTSISSMTSSAPQSKSKHRHYHHLLRSRKDPTKSSSNSNSKVRTETEALYAFHPSANGGGMSVNELQQLIQDLEKMGQTNAAVSVDRDTVADETWNLLTSLVNPLFLCERLKTPVEEVNKLVYLHLRFKTSQDRVSNSNNSALSPVVSPTIANAQLGLPAPHFALDQFSPAGSISSPANFSNVVLSEICDFIKAGMNHLMNQLYVDETTHEVKLKRSIKLDMSLHSSSTRSKNYTLGNPTNIDFEKGTAVLWDYFYSHIYFYLLGVFLPIDNEIDSILKSSSNSQINRYGINGSSGTTNGNGFKCKNFVRNMILTSFRDNIVIPLFEMDTPLDPERDRKRDIEMSSVSAISNISFSQNSQSRSSIDRKRSNSKVNSVNDASMNGSSSMSNSVFGKSGTNSLNSQNLNNGNLQIQHDYTQILSLLQCFTILCSIQSNDTNQKIIENLLDQTKEKSRYIEATI
ncbi:hypothetical protein B5S33_g1963 [[Candida] boidinii]|nr:hypothetical protein B5S30_g2339 [[Candida] boidinii]OWB83334.1 hypothetical protein B5S33_g1963 [[Candida] boidinii]GMG07938.1 unnamed protein product [[Candida] boidinii]